jgi:hypothetical protein
MALGSIEPLTKMGTRKYCFGGGKDGRCIRLIADSSEIWASQPPGTLRSCTGLAFALCNELKEVGRYRMIERSQMVHSVVLWFDNRRMGSICITAKPQYSRVF